MAFARTVLPVPGTSSMSRWPRHSRATRASRTSRCLPTMTRSTLARTLSPVSWILVIGLSRGLGRRVRWRQGRAGGRSGSAGRRRGCQIVRPEPENGSAFILIDAAEARIVRFFSFGFLTSDQGQDPDPRGHDAADGAHDGKEQLAADPGRGSDASEEDRKDPSDRREADTLDDGPRFTGGCIGDRPGFTRLLGSSRVAHPPPFRYSDMRSPAIGAATSPPRPACSTRTPMAIFGFSAGAKPMNHEWGSPVPPSSAVPDLPAVVMPWTFAPEVNCLPRSPSTAATIAVVMADAFLGEITRPLDVGPIRR